MDYNLNYLIKYAVEPIHENADNASRLLGYIVTKCYVMMHTEVYHGDGTYSEQYYVVYPYKGLNTYLKVKNRRYPDISRYKMCLNQELSTDVYDTYNEAKKVCNEMNGFLFRNYFPNESLLARLDYFQELENSIMRDTTDMNISSNEKVKMKRRS